MRLVPERNNKPLYHYTSKSSARPNLASGISGAL